MDLEQLRVQIDQIDSRLVELLNQRAALALQIGKRKRESCQSLIDEQREQQVLLHIARRNRGPLAEPQLIEIFRLIIAVCRKIQEEA